MYNGNHFDGIDDLLGRRIKCSIEGRSGGWFVVHEELTDEELEKLDKHIESCMKGLSQFLADERKLKHEEKNHIYSIHGQGD